MRDPQPGSAAEPPAAEPPATQPPAPEPPAPEPAAAEPPAAEPAAVEAGPGDPSAPDGAWSQLLGQQPAIDALRAAVEDPATMTHAWLFTGPPGSGRSVAARVFAAALQCSEATGCGECTECRTTLAGTHADVTVVVPEGLSISVTEMRSLVPAAARMPVTGRWQVVIIEDADRLTEGASNALLKALEEPPERTVFLLCAPSDHPEDIAVTVRSRCRLVALATPPVPAIARVLIERDGVAPAEAEWAAAVCGGHVGRARRLATDSEARERRAEVLRIPLGVAGLGDVFDYTEVLIRAAEADAEHESNARDEAEKAELRTAMGADGSGKGAAAAKRSAEAAVKALQKQQKARATRIQRDTLDLALIDLAGFYRDVLVTAAGTGIAGAAAAGAGPALNHPDHVEQVRAAAARWSRPEALRRWEAVLECREALRWNVKPRIAVEAMGAVLAGFAAQ